MEREIRTRVGDRVYADIARIAEQDGGTISETVRALILAGFRWRFQQDRHQDAR